MLCLYGRRGLVGFVVGEEQRRVSAFRRQCFVAAVVKCAAVAQQQDEVGLVERLAGAAVACLVVRLPEVIALLISPEGIPGWLPPARSWTYLWVILGWLVSSAVMLCARHWLGAVSAAWLFVMSSIGSVSLLKRGHVILGTLELVVCVVGLGGLLLAVAAGAFRRRGGETR